MDDREIPRLFTRSQTCKGLSWSVDCSTIIMIAAIVAFVVCISSSKRRTMVKRVATRAASKLRQRLGRNRKVAVQDEKEPFGEVAPAPFESTMSQAVPPHDGSGFSSGNGLDLCHPNCCCDTQWPVPAELTGPGASIEEQTLLADFDKTTLRCRGCNGVGCLCAKKGETVLPTCGSTR